MANIFSSLWFAICISLSQSLINVLVAWVTKGQGRLNKFNMADLSALIETFGVALISTVFFLEPRRKISWKLISHNDWVLTRALRLKAITISDIFCIFLVREVLFYQGKVSGF